MDQNLKIGLLLIITFLLLPNLCTGEIQIVNDTELIIIYPSSIASQVSGYIEQYSQSYPEISIKKDSYSNSTEIVKAVLADELEYDIIMVPDYTILGKNLMPVPHSWYIRYGYCRMVLAYTNESAYAQEITAENWYEILAMDDVTWAMITPETDSRGWRSLVSIGLADSYYEEPVFENLIDPDTNISIKSSGEDLIITSINSQQIGNLIFHTDMDDIVISLKDGTIDYAWMYQGGAYQNNLSWIVLPDEIDLSTSKYEERYKTVSVITNYGVKQSSPIIFAVSIPDNAKNRDAAIAFTQILLSPEGMRVLDHLGQEAIVPAERYGEVPAEVAALTQSP